jgi:hypothetical protein
VEGSAGANMGCGNQIWGAGPYPPAWDCQPPATATATATTDSGTGSGSSCRCGCGGVSGSGAHVARGAFARAAQWHAPTWCHPATAAATAAAVATATATATATGGSGWVAGWVYWIAHQVLLTSVADQLLVWLWGDA